MPIRLKVTTNASNGYSIASRTSGSLINDDAIPIPNANVGPVGNAITVGTPRYGVIITPGSITGAGTNTLSSTFGAGANVVQYNHATTLTLLTSTGVNGPAASGDTANTVLVTHYLNISGNTEAGNYTQSSTYTIIPNF